jgi:hypothetical protein
LFGVSHIFFLTLHNTPAKIWTINNFKTGKNMETYKIQTNASGTRSMTISGYHLATIRKYALFDNLVDSNGIIDESVLDKLKLNIRAMLESDSVMDKQLLDLCLDVVYNNNMKAFGLNQLVTLYEKWEKKQDTEENA